MTGLTDSLECTKQQPAWSRTQHRQLLSQTHLFQQYAAHWVHQRHCAIMHYINWQWHCHWHHALKHWMRLKSIHVRAVTLMFRPLSMTSSIWLMARNAASGMSYSMKANPLCLLARWSNPRLMLLMGPKGRNACFTMSSPMSKFMLPT